MDEVDAWWQSRAVAGFLLSVNAWRIMLLKGLLEPIEVQAFIGEIRQEIEQRKQDNPWFSADGYDLIRAHLDEAEALILSALDG